MTTLQNIYNIKKDKMNEKEDTMPLNNFFIYPIVLYIIHDIFVHIFIVHFVNQCTFAVDVQISQTNIGTGGRGISLIIIASENEKPNLSEQIASDRCSKWNRGKRKKNGI